MVHVLSRSYSNYDESVFRIVGVFETREEAEATADSLLLHPDYKGNSSRDEFVVTACEVGATLNETYTEHEAGRLVDHEKEAARKAKKEADEAAKAAEAARIKKLRCIDFVPIPGDPKHCEIRVGYQNEE